MVSFCDAMVDSALRSVILVSSCSRTASLYWASSEATLVCRRSRRFCAIASCVWTEIERGRDAGGEEVV